MSATPQEVQSLHSDLCSVQRDLRALRDADPLEFVLAESLRHPGANDTGVTFLNAELATKRLEPLHGGRRGSAALHADSRTFSAGLIANRFMLPVRPSARAPRAAPESASDRREPCRIQWPRRPPGHGGDFAQ